MMSFFVAMLQVCKTLANEFPDHLLPIQTAHLHHPTPSILVTHWNKLLGMQLVFPTIGTSSARVSELTRYPTVPHAQPQLVPTHLFQLFQHLFQLFQICSKFVPKFHHKLFQSKIIDWNTFFGICSNLFQNGNDLFQICSNTCSNGLFWAQLFWHLGPPSLPQPCSQGLVSGCRAEPVEQVSEHIPEQVPEQTRTVPRSPIGYLGCGGVGGGATVYSNSFAFLKAQGLLPVL